MAVKVAVVTADKRISIVYLKQLQYLFEDAVIVNTYSIEDKTAFLPKSEDVFLVTAISTSYFDEVMKSIPSNKPIVIGAVTFINDNLTQLKRFPIGTKAYLVNTTAKMAAESVTILYQKGINNIEFIPFYPGCPEDESITLAVTPSEQKYVPKRIQRMIDIGNRILDVNTIVDLAIKMNCEYLLETERFHHFFNSINIQNAGFGSLIEKSNRLKQEFETLVHMIDIGILGVDENNVIFACNQKAANLLGKKLSEILFQNAADMIPNAPFEKCKNMQAPVKLGEFMAFGNKLDMTITPMIRKGVHIGSFATIALMGAGESIQRQLNMQIMKKGHRARYTFDDIIGKSAAIRKTIEIARKMAKTTSTVLITGESGTGKELFAHAIHNSSSRKDFPFVAINCAAIPDNLLESELFGYEEGSFTGAKKGGKLGLFEIANKGSIFLDEIEGMSTNLQIKLLRVIQEKEIMRVGGDNILPIDVRIIAASNESLKSCVDSGRFRQDLYYRINTLPIHVPPLRERGEDIFQMIEEFKSALGSQFVLTENTRNYMKNYSWPGNVRELRNCVEYLSCLGEKVIETKHLPNYLFETEMQANFIPVTEPLYESRRIRILKAIAQILKKEENFGAACGRKQIASILCEGGIMVTETQVRSILSDMKKKDLIEVSKGRGGTRLTEKGFLELLKEKA